MVKQQGDVGTACVPLMTNVMKMKIVSLEIAVKEDVLENHVLLSY